MKPKKKSYTTRDERFCVGYIAKPEDMVGKLEPFRPCWNVQYNGDGTQEFFDTEKECLEWIKQWDEI